MIEVAWVALAALGWLIGVQMLRVGHDRSERPARLSLITKAVLGGSAVLLVVPWLDDGRSRVGQPPDLTALVLVVLTTWLIGLQMRAVGRGGCAQHSGAVRVTTAVLVGAAVLLAVPRLYFMVT